MSVYYDYTEDTVREWLQEPVHLATQGPGRVDELVHETPQQRHWWPTFPARRSQAMFSATRVVAAGITFAIVSGSLLLAPSLLYAPVEPVPAVTSPSPSPAVTPDETVDVAASPSAVPEPAAVSTFAATRVIAELADGSDPIDLVPAPAHRPGAVFIDRSTHAVMHVEDDGELRVLMQKGIDDRGRTLDAEPVALGLSGSHLVVLDGDGALHKWEHWGDVGRVLTSLAEALPPDADVPDETSSTVIDPPVAMAATALDELEFDLYAIDADDAELHLYEARRVQAPDLTLERNGQEFTYRGRTYTVVADSGEPIRREGLPSPRDIVVDSAVYVLTAGGVERYSDGVRDPDFELATTPGAEPDYRFLGASGSGADGQLWLFDAASGSFASFDKADGSYLQSWAPDTGPLEEVRGMYVIEGADGAADSVTWLTPGAVFRGALANPAATRPHVTPAPDPKGRLTTAERTTGKRAIDWSDAGIELKADAMTLRVKDRVVRPPAGVFVGGDTQANEAELEIEWDDDGIEQRVYFVFDVDDTHWWIDWIWVYDGEKDGDWIEFENLESLTRTPLGKSLVGDLRIESTSADRKKYDAPGTAVLRFDGLKLSALVPGTRPAPLTDCRPFVDDRFEITREYEWDSEDDTWSTGYGGRILRKPGEPLHGMKENDMTPKEVETVLKDLGICYRFRHEWWSWEKLQGGRQRRMHYDFRCTAPDTGNITALEPGPGYPAADGTAVIYVTVREKGARDWPAPPPAGTDCPTQ